MKSLSLGLGFTPAQNATTGGAPAATYHLELEASTDDLLLESGDYLLLEEAP